MKELVHAVVHLVKVIALTKSSSVDTNAFAFRKLLRSTTKHVRHTYCPLVMGLRSTCCTDTRVHVHLYLSPYTCICPTRTFVYLPPPASTAVMHMFALALFHA